MSTAEDMLHDEEKMAEDDERISRTVLCLCSERARAMEETILRGVETRHALMVKQRALRDLDWEEALEVAAEMIEARAREDKILEGDAARLDDQESAAGKASARSAGSKPSPRESARSRKSNASGEGKDSEAFDEESRERARREEAEAREAARLEAELARRASEVDALARALFGEHVGAEIVVLSLCGSDAASVLARAFQEDEELASLLAVDRDDDEEERGNGEQKSARSQASARSSRQRAEGKEAETEADHPARAPAVVFPAYASCVPVFQRVFFVPPPLASGTVDFSAAANSANARQGRYRNRSTKSKRVLLRDLLDFVFPADQQHPWSTGRLLVFGEFGPLNSESRLESGIKGSYVVQKHEINTMIEQINVADMLYIYVQDAVLSPEEAVDVIKQVDPQIRRDKQISREEVIALFENVAVDATDRTMCFHEMQAILADFRAARIERWKQMAANSVRRAAPLSKKQRAARLRHESAIRRASALALRRAPKIDDIDAFLATSKLLNRHSFEICNLKDKNHPSLVQNVRILRQAESPAVALGATPWSPALR